MDTGVAVGVGLCLFVAVYVSFQRKEKKKGRK